MGVGKAAGYFRSALTRIENSRVAFRNALEIGGSNPRKSNATWEAFESAHFEGQRHIKQAMLNLRAGTAEFTVHSTAPGSGAQIMKLTEDAGRLHRTSDMLWGRRFGDGGLHAEWTYPPASYLNTAEQHVREALEMLGA